MTTRAFLAALLAAPAALLAQPSGDLLVRADRLVISPGNELTERAAILVRDGKVAFLGPEIPAPAAAAAREMRFEGTIAPGFVDPHAHLGIAKDLAEAIDAVTPDLSAADALDPFDDALGRAARYGVCTLALAPRSANAFAGRAAMVRAGVTGTLLMEDAYLKLALVDESLDQNRFPTSRMGAVDLMRLSFARARDAANDDRASQAIRRTLDGGRLAFHTRRHAGITSALDLCDELGVQPLLIGADEAARSTARLVRTRGSVVLAPLNLDSPLRHLRLPATLEAAGVPFSFMTEAPPRDATAATGRAEATNSTAHPEALRVSAALAVRHGASRTTALAAITRVPAEQCGAADRCGSLLQGRDASFVVVGGDPLDLGAPLLAVFVAGKRVDLEDRGDDR